MFCQMLSFRKKKRIKKILENKWKCDDLVKFKKYFRQYCSGKEKMAKIITKYMD